MSGTNSSGPDSVRPRSVAIANSSLLVLVFFTVFVVPLFPLSYHWVLYNLSYTGIYLLAAMAIQRLRREILLAAFSVIALEWASELFDLPLLNSLAGTITIVFFILIVILLITQIARSRKVTGRLIVESINAYLLLGLIFALLVILLAGHQPGAYSFIGSSEADELRSSDCFYYAFVTMTTVGYGDLLPESAQAKSLATLMGMTGQLYLAVILAMLVGKWASSGSRSEEE